MAAEEKWAKIADEALTDAREWKARFRVAEQALRRIAFHEYRADRRHKGMVDVSVVQDLQRIARNALKDN